MRYALNYLLIARSIYLLLGTMGVGRSRWGVDQEEHVYLLLSYSHSQVDPRNGPSEAQPPVNSQIGHQISISELAVLVPTRT